MSKDSERFKLDRSCNEHVVENIRTVISILDQMMGCSVSIHNTDDILKYD